MRAAPASTVARLVILVAVLAASAVPARAAGREPVPRRLLRTVQIGVPQDITVEQIRKIAESDTTDYTTAMLARSALLVQHQDEPKLISFDELLDALLNHIVADGTPYTPLASLPNFRAKETVFTMVYAMVMSGSQDRAVDILARHSLTGSRYKQAVVLSALRNVGTPRAFSVIQEYAEKGQDRNLAETTLADENYPVLSEIHDRWNLVPPSERTQDNLRTIVQSGCNQRTVLAAYWLGFFAPNPDAREEAAELGALEKIAQTNAPDCEMMEHVIALKALGLRSAEGVDYWKRLAQRTPNVWERHQIVLNAYGRWGVQFLPAALDLLKTDTAQYVQWELLNGNLEMRQGKEYRNYWDIWIPADVLLVLQFDDVEGRRAMEPAQLDVMLDWLDAGARPRDPVVLNHMIYHLLAFSSDDETRRLLRVFDKTPQRNENWWVLQRMRDPSALPLLTYWSTLPAPKDQQDILKHVVESLSNQPAKRNAKPVGCCEGTEACLIEQVKQNAPPAALVTYEIHSDVDAQRWLGMRASGGVGIRVRYADDTKRAAIVRRPDGSEERWEYLYDCWRKADAPAQDAAH